MINNLVLISSQLQYIDYFSGGSAISIYKQICGETTLQHIFVSATGTQFM
jgi:hypothetical protein